MIERRQVDGQNAKHDEERHDPLAEQSGGAPVFAKAREPEKRHRNDNPDTPCEDRHTHCRHQERPRPQPQPQLSPCLRTEAPRNLQQANDQRASGERDRHEYHDPAGKRMREGDVPPLANVHHAPSPRRSAPTMRRTRRQIVTMPPMITTISTRLGSSSPAMTGCHPCGASADHSPSAMISNIRCCFAIGPEKSLGPPAALPAART